MYKTLRKHLEKCLEDGTPDWMTKERMILIQKDEGKGNTASNYRPITCLPLLWKLLTGVIADEMYEYLGSRSLLPEEQNGCKRKSRGTHDLLYIDRMVLKEVKQRSCDWVNRLSQSVLHDPPFMDYGVPERFGSYQDLVRELKKQWNMKIVIIPIVLGHWELSRRHHRRE